MTFFAGNSKNLLIKKQVDKDTPVTDFSGALNLRVYEWAPLSARAISALQESDSSTQEGASHVTAIGPGFSFGIYGRPSEIPAIVEAVLGDNDNSATSSPTTHTASPDNDQPYYSILEVIPYGGGTGPRFDGCRCFGVEFTAQDDGNTELRLTGITWVALGLTHGVTVPSPLPAPADELPFIYAEAAISYGGVHLGTTKSFTFTIDRNGARRQGDSGFRAVDATPGLFQCSGSFSRYTADDDTMRAIDTGTTGGTALTSDIFTQAAAVLFSRGSGGTLRSVLIAAPEISYETRAEALNLDGSPYVEVLGFRTQPQPLLADALSIVTINGLATTGT